MKNKNVSSGKILNKVLSLLVIGSYKDNMGWGDYILNKLNFKKIRKQDIILVECLIFT